MGEPSGLELSWLLRLRRQIVRIDTWLMPLVALLVFGLVIYDLGFKKDVSHNLWLVRFYSTMHWICAISLGARLYDRWKGGVALRALGGDAVSWLLFVLVIVFIDLNPWGDAFLPNDSSYNVVVFFVFLVLFLTELTRLKINFSIFKLSPATIFLGSFGVIILAGALALMMPNSTYGGIGFLDAFFTSTSAVCVTGLSTVDTQFTFTYLGKLIIMLLIQAGGLGIMTFTFFFSYIFRGRSSVGNQLYLKDFINEDNLGQVFSTLQKVVGVMLFIEAVGAVFIYWSLHSGEQYFSLEMDKIEYAIFHSVSAFNNAGFSTLSGNLYEPIIRDNYHLHLIICFLIIFGGIGFPILLNYLSYLKYRVKNLFLMIQQKKVVFRPRIINVNTKLTVYTTAFLLLFGTLYLFYAESAGSLQGKSGYGKLVTAFMLSVSPRTAGFNSYDMNLMTTPAILVTILLMWIGASPGSTGGGIKTTTFAVGVLNAISIARNKLRMELFKREIASESVRRAFAVMLLSLLVIGLGILVVAYLEPQVPILKVVFECFSAYGTVGLSLGLTSTLSEGSKIVLIVLMFLGRVNTLTLLIVLFDKVPKQKYRYPEENIYIT